ncbi:MAG: hypothetical protein JWO70_2896 [Betaproteobacteria bacterium]|nr:hypothetical protein [Betaproteobacteria bacterium]
MAIASAVAMSEKENALSILIRSAVALAFALAFHGALAAATAEPAKGGASKSEPAKAEPAKSEIKKADENRKKPLQRCDELADKAQLECLKKARERVVEARKKREAAGEKAPASAARGVDPKKSGDSTAGSQKAK